MTKNNSWNSTIPITVSLGGSGQTTLTANDILLGNGTSGVASLTAGTDGQILVAGGASTNPAFITPTAGTGISLTTNATTLSYALTSAFTVATGGTGDTSFTANEVLCGGTTSTGALQQVSGLGTATQILTSNGAAALPSWGAVSITNANMYLIQTQTASSSASIVFSYGITALYPNYLILMSNVSLASSSVAFSLDMSTDGGISYFTNNYSCGVNWTGLTSYTLTNANSTSTCPIIDSNLSMSSSDFFGGLIYLYNLGASYNFQSYMGQYSSYDSGANSSYGTYFGVNSSGGSTVNAIKLSASSGNIAGGTFSLYQISN